MHAVRIIIRGQIYAKIMQHFSKIWMKKLARWEMISFSWRKSCKIDMDMSMILWKRPWKLRMWRIAEILSLLPITWRAISSKRHTMHSKLGTGDGFTCRTINCIIGSALGTNCLQSWRKTWRFVKLSQYWTLIVAFALKSSHLISNFFFYSRTPRISNFWLKLLPFP